VRSAPGFTKSARRYLRFGGDGESGGSCTRVPCGDRLKDGCYMLTVAADSWKMERRVGTARLVFVGSEAHYFCASGAWSLLRRLHPVVPLFRRALYGMS
jgi:hypothetical protein